MELKFQHLQAALRASNLNLVRILFETTPEIDAHFVSELLYRTIAETSLECVDLLLEKGASVYFTGKTGLTTVRIAVESGRTDIVECLLASGVSPNFRCSSDAYTLLHVAVEKGYKSVTQILIDHGANVNSLIKTCKYSADQFFCHTCTEKDEEIRNVSEFYAKHGSLYDRGVTPLILSAERGDAGIMEVLLRAGARIESRTDEGRSALTLAVEKGDLEAVKVLLRHGARVDVRDEAGQTPLHIASREGDLRGDEVFNTQGAPSGGQFWKEKGDLESGGGLSNLGIDSQEGDRREDETPNSPSVPSKGQSHKRVKDVEDQDGMTPSNIASREGCLREDGASNAQAAPSSGQFRKVKDNLKNCGSSHEGDPRARESPNTQSAPSSGQFETVISNVKGTGGPTSHIASRESGMPEVEVMNIQAVPSSEQFRIVKDDLKNRVGSTYPDIDLREGCLTEIDVSYTQATPSSGQLRKLKDNLRNSESSLKENLCVGVIPNMQAAPSCGQFWQVKDDLKNGGFLLEGDLCAGVMPTTQAAPSSGYFEIVKLLVEYGANVDACDGQDCTPLHNATGKGFTDCVKYLIESGAAVDAVDSWGRTALHTAARNGRLEEAELLLTSGWQVNAKTHYPCETTPLSMAIGGRFPGLVRVLLKHGARTNAKAFATTFQTLSRAPKDSTSLQILQILLERSSADEKLAQKSDICDLVDHLSRLLTVRQNRWSTEGDWGPCSNYVMRYVVSLNAAGAYNFSKVELSAFKCYETEINPFLDKCKAEVVKMKQEQPSEGISFYEILTKDISQLAKFARNEKVVEAMGSVREKFPIYAEILLGQFEKGVLRRDLLARNVEKYRSSFVLFSGLPCEVVEKIVDYLPNEELRKAVLIFRPSKAVNEQLLPKVAHG